MQKSISSSKYFLTIPCLLYCLSCSGIGSNSELSEIAGDYTFAILDVGQGLSQIGVKDDKAVVWDMGDLNKFTQWQDGYTRLGTPFIKAIIISHGDMDHYGGLQALPDTTPFSGLVVTSPYEDTAALRAFAVNWTASIRFKTVKQGDTLAVLDNLYIECLWPPYGTETEQWVEDNFTKNRLSFCFKVVYGNTSVLITSDIDTVSEDKIVEAYTYSLSSDIVVVPHHGSRGSLYSLFYGYINPQSAIISCGLSNKYGHPSDDVVKLLAFQMLVTVLDTRYDGHILGRSNGEYWVW